MVTIRDLDAEVYPNYLRTNIGKYVFNIVPGKLSNGEYRWYRSMYVRHIDGNINYLYVYIYNGDGTHDLINTGIEYDPTLDNTLSLVLMEDGYYLYTNLGTIDTFPVGVREMSTGWSSTYDPVRAMGSPYVTLVKKFDLVNSVSVSEVSSIKEDVAECLTKQGEDSVTLANLTNTVNDLLTKIEALEQDNTVSVTIDFGDIQQSVDIPSVNPNSSTTPLTLYIDGVTITFSIINNLTKLYLYSNSGALLKSYDVSSSININGFAAGVYVITDGYTSRLIEIK